MIVTRFQLPLPLSIVYQLDNRKLKIYTTTKQIIAKLIWSPIYPPITQNCDGSHRAIVPVGLYEKVMPLDIVPVPLLKSLCIQDTEQLQNLGALELDEEDLGLCSFVCASKNDYGSMLREALATIEKEG